MTPWPAALIVLHADRRSSSKLPTPPGGAKEAAKLQGSLKPTSSEEIANGTLKKEDLGVQTINGISAQGTRYTRTIPAGQIGNANPIPIVNERWYSPDLQMVVKSVRTDPRLGQTTYTLTNIQRTEPAASFFTVPSDYTVKQAKIRAHGAWSGVGPVGRRRSAGHAPATAKRIVFIYKGLLS